MDTEGIKKSAGDLRSGDRGTCGQWVSRAAAAVAVYRRGGRDCVLGAGQVAATVAPRFLHDKINLICPRS